MAGCEDSLYVGYTVVNNALEMLKAESRAENYFLSSCVYEIESSLLSCGLGHLGPINQELLHPV